MRSLPTTVALALGALLAAALEASPAPRWQRVPQHGDVPPPVWEAGLSFSGGSGEPDTVYRFGGQSGVYPVDFNVNGFYALDLETATWTNLGSPATPGPRANPLMIPGPCRNCVSLAGGRGRFRTSADLMFPEMWTYKVGSGRWDLVPPDDLGDPFAVRRAAALVVEVPAARHRRRETTLYAFGGVGNTLPAFPTTPTGLRNDLAVYDRETGWRLVETSGTKPAPRAWTAGGYDPVTHSLLVFGGYRLGEDQGPGTPSADLFGPTNFDNDLWSLSLDTFTWTRLNPQGPLPFPRDNAAAFFDTAHGWLVIFGGQRFDGVMNDLWHYSAAANRWTEVILPPGARVPPGRVGAVSFVRETPEAFELYLHSGVTSEGGASVLLNDLWKLTWPKD